MRRKVAEVSLERHCKQVKIACIKFIKINDSLSYGVGRDPGPQGSTPESTNSDKLAVFSLLHT